MTPIATVSDLTGQVPLRLLTISLADLTDDVTDVLTTGVEQLSHDLVAAANQRVVLDLRVADSPSPEVLGQDEAMIELARGLVQGYVAESGSTVEPVNVVISTKSQGTDRETTWRFLSDQHGGLARGATLDLRSHR